MPTLPFGGDWDELAGTRLRIARLVPTAGPALVILMLIVNLILGVLPVVFIVATSKLLGALPEAVRGGLGSPGYHTVVTMFLVGAAAFVAQQIVTPLATSLGELAMRRVDGAVLDQLMAASMGPAGVAALEDQQVLDDLQVATRELEFRGQSPGSACAGLIALTNRYTQLLGYALVVAVAYSWLAAAGLIVAVLLFRYGQRGGLRKYTKIWVEPAATARIRKSDYLRGLAVQPPAGKEIRVFGLVGWLRAKVREAYLGVLGPVWAERRRVYLWPFVFFAGWGLVVAAAVLAVTGYRAAEGLPLTSFILVVQAVLAALRLGDFFPESDVQTAFGMLGYDAVRSFERRLAGFPDGVDRTRTDMPDPVRTITFDNVTFAYPGQERPVLAGLDLTIEVGGTTAIVGINGAGKTTLIKLLTRLYEPTAGAIRVDGVDIREYSVAAWRRKLGVIFQDYARYEASAADNIAFGAVHAADDQAGIRAAAEATGLAETLEALPLGMRTPLARQLSGGVELSGGQWQRIALARALFALRHGSPIVVLDEPTASLDVRAEATFFTEFAELTQGATTLLISHRFSTVRHADQIVVLERGQVEEQGTHEQLLARDGRYARLFRLQADRFTDDGGDEEPDERETAKRAMA